MRRLARWLAAAACAVAGSVCAGTPIDGRDLGDWSMSYYRDPQPDRVAEALRIARTELLEQNPDAEAPLIGFFAEVFRANPQCIAAWTSPYAGQERLRFLYGALWVADTDESVAALRSLRASAPASERAVIDSLPTGRSPRVEAMVIDHPADLDHLWGRFFASGGAAPVLRIAREVVPPDPSKRDIGRLLLSSAARWSLTANATQHARVLDIVETQVRSAPDDAATPQLRDIAERARRASTPPTRP